MDMIYLFLLIGGLLIIGFIADYIFKKFRIPDVIILLLVGLLINFFGIITISSYHLISIFYSLALMFILFEAGTELKFYSVLKEIPKATILAILVFILSTITVGFLAIWLFHVNFIVGILLGSIIGGSSSTIVIPSISNLRISKNTKYILTLESTVTDALCILVAIALAETIAFNNSIDIMGISHLVISSFSIAIVIGFIFGLLWLYILPRVKKYEFHYLLTIGMVLIIYSITEMFSGVGAISSLIFGIVLGNAALFGKSLKMKEVTAMTPTENIFHKLIGFILRVFFFIFLGIIVSISNISVFAYGIIITLSLLLIRILCVKIIIKQGDKNEKKLISIMMPRGLAAAVLASIPLIQYNIAETIFFPEVVFSVILVSSIISATGILILKIK